jgi:23S rRNA (cytosine1962-C5)-methyltransferase
MNAIDTLPGRGDRRVAVHATPAGARAVRSGDPWLFDGSITREGDGSAGDLAVVFDPDRDFAGIGLFDPASPIRVRMLHHGQPTDIDDRWWGSRIDTALARRESLAADEATTAYRLIHGENDGLPGLVVDRYADTLVAKIYTPAWLPNLRSVLPPLIERTGADRVVLRTSRALSATSSDAMPGDGAVLFGDPPAGPIGVLERGLRLGVDVVAGHKTGHFLDQRDNRALVRSLAEGAEVLDVFSSTGGFSLSAAAGGARSAHMVDVSGPALSTAEENLRRNRHLTEVAACRVTSTRGDAFEVLEGLVADGRVFDLVVLDPPSFARAANQVDRAIAAYERLAALGIELTRSGGTMVQASCSARIDVDTLAGAVSRAAGRSSRRVREIRRTGHPVDHPIGFRHGAYLKALYVSVVDSGTKN